MKSKRNTMMTSAQTTKQPLQSALPTTEEEVWASPSWIQFQKNAIAFFEQGEGNEETFSPSFEGAFDDLCNKIDVVESSLREERGITVKSQKAGVLLKPFCASQLDSRIRLMSYSSFRETLEQGITICTLLRQIQWQLKLRLALWERMGNNAFIASWMQHILRDMPAKRRRRVKKQGHGTGQAWKLCCEDVTSLISFGLMKGLQERDGSIKVEAFLTSCRLEYIQHKLPWKSRLVKEVWTFFDLVQGAKPIKKAQPAQGAQPSAVLPPLSVPEEESIKTQTTASSTTTNKENAQSYFGKKRVKLTAPAVRKTNSLLGKSARSRYVGSHFNTNLTNMSALFRTVPSQLPVERKPIKPVAVQKRPITSRVVKAVNGSVAVHVSETPAPQRKRSRVVWETPENIRFPRVLRL